MITTSSKVSLENRNINLNELLLIAVLLNSRSQTNKALLCV